MRKTQLLTAAILIGAISGAPQFAAAMGESNPTPPQSSISISFSVSDNNTLDWTSVFFRWPFDAALCNRRSNFALVGGLDSHQVC